MKKTIITFAALICLVSCGFWTNFTTYFNTYYNAERLISESEKEFSYQDEKARAAQPRTHIPDYNLLVEDVSNKSGVPPFMTEFIISKAKLQPVRIKLDSVLIKGSKILAKKSESSFVEGTLLLMAQAYFYRSEWLPCEVKCGELIDIFPAGDKSPDAHLLLAKSLLIQKKFDYGKKVLSRTVDICWQLERYDILSEAFRLQADLSIYENDLEGALRPYNQAIAQSNSNKLRAKWQLDKAVLLYKLRQYERAEQEFAKVYENYSPEYVQLFEAQLYQSISLSKLGRYYEADKLLTELEEDGKWEEWLDYSKVGRMFLLKEKLNDTTDKTISPSQLDSAEIYADTAFNGQTLFMAYQYDRGAEEFLSSNYPKAKLYMDKARRRRTSIFDEATMVNKHLGNLLNSQSKALPYIGKEKDLEKYNPSQYDKAAKSSFNVGRIFNKFGMEDSVEHYYKASMDLSSYNDPMRPKYIWAYANMIRERDPMTSDSLLQIIVDNHPNTEYSVESSKILGFTDAYLIDSAKEVYSSGVEHRKYSNFVFAINQFKRCYNEFPRSEYAPKALYHAGWIFENETRQPDSAMKYYRILVDQYPNSVYANDIIVSLAYLESKINGEDVPDSLNIDKQKKSIQDILTKEEIDERYPQISKEMKKMEKRGFLDKAKDFFKSTINSNIDSAKSQVSGQYDKVKEIKNIDPSKLQDLKVGDIKGLVSPSGNSSTISQTEDKAPATVDTNQVSPNKK